MIKLDMHTHSAASGHGTHDTITDMAKTAAAIGLSMLGITDHAPATFGSGSASYFRSLKLAPKKRAGITVLYGVELNILDVDGTVDLSDDILAGLDYAIAAMHTANIKPGSITDNTNAYIKTMKNPYVKMIAHCDDEKYPVDYEALVNAAIEHRVILEINNASLSPDTYRGNTLSNNVELLKYCHKYRHPIILSSDSHGKAHVGDMDYALEIVDKSHFPKELILNYDMEACKRFLLHG